MTELPPPGKWRTDDGRTPFMDVPVSIIGKPPIPIVPVYPENEVRWVETPVAPWGAVMRVPHYVVNWDGWRAWEAERFKSIDENVKRGDVLFDIGSEVGWQSAVLAQIVGGENFVLFEPDATAWSCIRGFWRHNNISSPRAMFHGFVSDVDNQFLDSSVDFKSWPKCSYSSAMAGHDDSGFFYKSYRHTRDAEELKLPSITLDTFCEIENILPNVLNIDVEGAELKVLKGAVGILEESHPKVWVSVHPDQLEGYQGTTKEIEDLMLSFGYAKTVLAVDHEEHWSFL